MALTQKVKVGDHEVTTTVVNTKTQLDHGLVELLSTISAKMSSTIRPLIALDIEKHYYQDESKRQVTEKVAVVKLCFDKTCLIIQLLHLKEPPCSLAEFLQFQELTFVGVGIKHCLDALSRDYGMMCRNAVDLGQVAATVKRYEMFKACGVIDLAFELEVLDSTSECWIWHDGGAATLGSWGTATLSQQLIEAATWGAFLCSCVGDHLLTGSGYSI